MYTLASLVGANTMQAPVKEIYSYVGLHVFTNSASLTGEGCLDRSLEINASNYIAIDYVQFCTLATLVDANVP